MSNKTVSSGISLSTVLFIIFLVLKLTGNLTWSWLWILSPLWISWGLYIIIVFLCYSFLGILYLFNNKKKRKY